MDIAAIISILVVIGIVWAITSHKAKKKAKRPPVTNGGGNSGTDTGGGKDNNETPNQNEVT